MAKDVVSKEQYNEILTKYEDMADYFLTMQETVGVRILQNLYDALPEKLKEKESRFVKYEDNSLAYRWVTHLTPNVRDLFDYKDLNLPHDEVQQFEWYSDLANAIDLLDDIASHTNNIMKRMSDFKEALTKIKRHENCEMPKDRSDEYGGCLLSEDGFRLVLNKYKREVRKDLNEDQRWSKVIVARDVEIRIEKTNGHQFTYNSDYDPGSKRIKEVINAAVREGHVKIVAYAQTRRDDQRRDENSTRRSKPITLWENPNEDIQAMRAFTDL